MCNIIASRYASRHILSSSLSPEIGRIVAVRASDIKYLGMITLILSLSRLCGCSVFHVSFNGVPGFRVLPSTPIVPVGCTLEVEWEAWKVRLAVLLRNWKTMKVV